MITQTDVQVALENLIAADDAFQAELVRVFGKAAGDARYDTRGSSTPVLAGLKAGFLGSQRDYLILIRAFNASRAA